MQRAVVREQSLRFRILTPQYRVAIVRLDIQGIFYFNYWNDENRMFFNLIRSGQCRFHAHGDILHKLVIEQDHQGFLAERLGDLEILSNRFVAGYPDVVQFELFLRSALNELSLGLIGASCKDQMSSINSAINRGKRTVGSITDKLTKTFLYYLSGRFPILDSPLILPVPTPENIDLMRKEWAIEVLNRLGDKTPSDEIIKQVMSNYEQDNWFRIAVAHIIDRDYPTLKTQMIDSATRLLEPLEFLSSARERWLSFLQDRLEQNDIMYNRPPACALRRTLFNHFPALPDDSMQVEDLYQDLLMELRRADELILIVENLTKLPVDLPIQNQILIDLNQFKNAKKTILQVCDLLIKYYDFEKNCAREPLPSDTLSRPPILRNPFTDGDPFNDPQRGWTDPVNPAWNDYRISDLDRSNLVFEKNNEIKELESFHNLHLLELTGESFELSNDYATVLSLTMKRHAPLRQYIAEAKELMENNKEKSSADHTMSLEQLFSSLKQKINV